MPITHRAVGTGNVLQFRGKDFQVVAGVVQGATDDEIRHMIADGTVMPVGAVHLDLHRPAAVATAVANASPIATRRCPIAGTIVGFFASVHGAPSTSTINLDVLKNGVSIFTTPATIDVSELSTVTAAAPWVLKTGAPIVLAQDDLLALNVTGTHSAATGLTVALLIVPAA